MRTSKTILHERQIQFYNSFGFLVLKKFYTSREMRQIEDAFHKIMEGIMGDDECIFNRSRLLMDEDSWGLTKHLNLKTLGAFAGHVIGKDVIGVSVVGNYFMGNTDWHPDNYNLQYEGVKFLIYLDQLTGSNGALRVISRVSFGTSKNRVKVDPSN